MRIIYHLIGETLKGNQVKVLSDPVTVNEEQSGDKPLHKNVRRCSFVKIHKPGDLLKESKLLPMKARLHTQRNDILLHTEYESKIFVLPYIRKRVPVAEDVGEVCFQEKGSRFFLHTMSQVQIYACTRN